MPCDTITKREQCGQERQEDCAYKKVRASPPRWTDASTEFVRACGVGLTNRQREFHELPRPGPNKEIATSSATKAPDVADQANDRDQKISGTSFSILTNHVVAVDPDSVMVTPCPVPWHPHITSWSNVIIRAVNIIRPIAHCDRDCDRICR